MKRTNCIVVPSVRPLRVKLHYIGKTCILIFNIETNISISENSMNPWQCLPFSLVLLSRWGNIPVLWLLTLGTQLILCEELSCHFLKTLYKLLKQKGWLRKLPVFLSKLCQIFNIKNTLSKIFVCFVCCRIEDTKTLN